MTNIDSDVERQFKGILGPLVLWAGKPEGALYYWDPPAARDNPGLYPCSEPDTFKPPAGLGHEIGYTVYHLTSKKSSDMPPQGWMRP